MVNTVLYLNSDGIGVYFIVLDKVVFCVVLPMSIYTWLENDKHLQVSQFND